MKLNVELKVEPIVQFYDRIAEQIGKDPDTSKYDCKKILVSKDRFDVIAQYYLEDESFGMNWICYGPKIDEGLFDDEVKIEDGFIEENVV